MFTGTLASHPLMKSFRRDKYSLNSNKQSVKCQHPHKVMAAALSYSGTCQGYHGFHGGSPPSVRGTRRDRRSRTGWKSGSSTGVGHLCVKSAPSYGPATLGTSHVIKATQQGHKARPPLGLVGPLKTTLWMMLSPESGAKSSLAIGFSLTLF